MKFLKTEKKGKEVLFNLLKKYFPKGYKIITPNDYKKLYKLVSDDGYKTFDVTVYPIIEPHYSIKYHKSSYWWSYQFHVKNVGFSVYEGKENQVDTRKYKSVTFVDPYYLKDFKHIFEDTTHMSFEPRLLIQVDPYYYDRISSSAVKLLYEKETYKEILPAEVSGEFDKLLDNI